MDKIQIFAKNLQPLHLAVCNERSDDPEKGNLRAVCGSNIVGLDILFVNPEILLLCPDCKWQLEHWKKDE